MAESSDDEMTLTKDQAGKIFGQCGELFIELYYKFCEGLPKKMVIAAMMGALGACAADAGVGRDKTINLLNKLFDELEKPDQESMH